jgi:small glutamine-rich tetratricopeptide repeat-containing protein alpha
MTIFDVYLKTRDKVAAETSTPPKPAVSPEDKAQAEKFKQIGNSQMSRKEHAEAIQSYTEAINLDPTSSVYYSNRAAAYSSRGDHQKAVEDAEKAIEVDPKFVKPFSRLG